MQFNVFVVLLVKITIVKKKFKEKLSFAHVLLMNVQNSVIKLGEMNKMRKSGQQIETGI